MLGLIFNSSNTETQHRLAELHPAVFPAAYSIGGHRLCCKRDQVMRGKAGSSASPRRAGRYAAARISKATSE
jgi:hypothetical protein